MSGPGPGPAQVTREWLINIWGDEYSFPAACELPTAVSKWTPKPQEITAATYPGLLRNVEYHYRQGSVSKDTMST
jgi:hypothetical protein